MHLPWMGFAGMMPGFPGQDVNRLLTDRAFMPRAFPQMGTNLNVVEVTATSTAPYYADLIECSNSSNITLSLHPAARMRGKVITIKKTGNNTNTVVIDPDSTETIDGETTITLFVRYDFLTLYSNGSNWQILSDGRFKHTAIMSQAAAQNVANTTYAKLLLDTSTADTTGTMVDTANNRIVCKRAGRYQIIGSLRFQSVPDGKFVQAAIDVSGAQVSYGNVDTAFTNSIPLVKDITVYPLAAGDTVSLYTYHNFGGTYATDAGAGSASPRLVIQEV